MAKTIEARLVIVGEDRASQISDNVAKAAKSFAKEADISESMRKLSGEAAKTEAAFNAVNKALAGRGGFAKAQADAKAAEASLEQYTKALGAARQAKAAFGNVRPAAGTDEAARYTAATKALREVTVAHQRAEREVTKTATAMRAEAAAMKEADSAAARLGADLSNLEGHQRRLKTAFEATTAALGREVQMQDRAAASARRHAQEQAEHARHVRQHGVVNLVATAAAGYVGVHGVIHTAERAAHAGAEVQRERVKLEAAGVPAAERQHITDESLKLAVEMKNVTQSSVMELWKEMRSVMTDPQRANVLDNLQREREVRDNLAKPDAPGLLTQGLDAIGYGSAEERQKRRDGLKAEAEKNIAEMEAQLAAIDAKIKAAAAMPLPPVRPPDMSQVEAKATETGQKAGQSIADGVKEKAPEVEQQGVTIFQRLQQLFSQGIFVPIRLAPGEGMGGGGSGGSLIQRASFGSGGDVGTGIGAGGGGGGGLGLRRRGGGSAGAAGGSMTAVPGSVQMTEAERNELGLITKYEAGGQNVPNYINDRTHTAQGYYQITNTNWRRIAPQLGIKAPNAMSASLEDQTRVALHLRRASGLGNWTRYNPRLRRALARGEQIPVGVKDAAAAEPRLVRGLDGIEGLDLGNGTMRMPNGSIRSITGGGPQVPEAPVGGGGGGAGGRGMSELREHVAELGRHIDKFGQSGFHGQIEVTGLRQAGLRATSLRVKGRGGLSADMGITEMGAKLNMGDPADWS